MKLIGAVDDDPWIVVQNRLDGDNIGEIAKAVGRKDHFRFGQVFLDQRFRGVHHEFMIKLYCYLL